MSARFVKAFALLAATAVVALVGAKTTRAALPTLYVNYTIRCTFTIVDDAGRPVTSIAPGTWQVLVTTPGSFGGVDLSGTFDMTACKGYVEFRLTGPGVNATTTLDDGDGSSDMLNVTLQPSATYVATDDHQPTVARGTFSTTATGTATGPTVTSTLPVTGTPSTSKGGSSTGALIPAGTPDAGDLDAAVSSTGVPTLTYNGKAAKTLIAGRYTFLINDKSSKAGFAVTQLGKNSKTLTTAAYVGKKTITITLSAGQWTASGGTGKPKINFKVT